MWFTEHFLKDKASGKVILFLDGYRAPYHCYRLLLKIKLQSFVYRVIVLIPFSLWMRAFLGLKSVILKAKPQLVKSLDIAWRLLRFAWSKVASVGVSVSAFESTGIYRFKRNRVPKYVLSISDTSENVTSMETAPPNNGCGLCSLYFRKQLAKCVTHHSRTFIKYCGSYSSFWHFPWRNYFLQTFEDQFNTEIPRKHSIEKNNNSLFYQWRKQ